MEERGNVHSRERERKSILNVRGNQIGINLIQTKE